MPKRSRDEGVSFVDLLGNRLRLPDGARGKTTELLENKEVIALYFAAEWSPPCRKFTPVLQQLYQSIYKDKGMEIIFISADCDINAFVAIHMEMPWLALPFIDRERKDKLTKLCRVEDMPTVVLFTPKGEIYHYDARKKIKYDPEGFPWIPRTVQQILHAPLTGPHPKCTPVNMRSLHSRYLGIYFSALWCSPCIDFAPYLMDAYKEIKARAPMLFEVIFVSEDTDQDEFTAYFKTMPWVALPWNDRPGKDDLKKLYDVTTLPTLVILDKETRAVLNQNAVDNVEEDIEGLDFPWEKKKAMDRFQLLVEGLNAGAKHIPGEELDKKRLKLMKKMKKKKKKNRGDDIVDIREPMLPMSKGLEMDDFNIPRAPTILDLRPASQLIPPPPRKIQDSDEEPDQADEGGEDEKPEVDPECSIVPPAEPAAENDECAVVEPQTETAPNKDDERGQKPDSDDEEFEMIEIAPPVLEEVSVSDSESSADAESPCTRRARLRRKAAAEAVEHYNNMLMYCRKEKLTQQQATNWES